MARRISLWQSLRWDLLLLLVAGLVFGLNWILDHPYLQTSPSEKSDGSRPPDRTEGDVLLLMPDSPAAEAKEFSELDCSYGWFNGLWQEFGSFGTSLVRNLSPELLAGRSVVIVPRRVASGMPSKGISALAGFVRQGGLLVVEQPPEGWERLTQVVQSGKPRPSQRITSIEGLVVRGPMRKHLPNVPLAGELRSTAADEPWPSGPVLMEIDGQPALLVHELGEGQVFTLLYDHACTLTAIQQGLPTRAMRFGKEELEAEMIPTSQRIAHERLRQNKVPYADLLERMLFEQLTRRRPLPRLWLFPGKHAGAMMIMHPTPDNTRAALGFADWSRRQEGSSTIFLAADRLNAPQLALLEKSQADLGLLWVRGIERPRPLRRVGVGGIKPLARELTLTDQIRMLEASAAGQEVRLGHVEGTLWTNDWSTTFQQLAHARIRMDTSFGPSEREESGYLFGTGLPYYPLDQRGLPLPLLELPFLLHSGSLSANALEQFLSNSEAYFHQSVVINLPSHAMRTAPRAGILLGLRDVHELTAKHNHWGATVSEYLDFMTARRKSVLTSQWSEETRRLTISVNLLGSRSRTIEGGALAGIAFPRTFSGDEVDRVVVDQEEIPLRSLSTTGSSTDRIVEVGPGRHTISVYYPRAVIEREDEPAP